ncbi:hypothetical protein Indivirus_2_35 [Indivirus ILV1]|uniref:NTF2 domain-containing protein n=1 Tax=Indivirus ILV1 TaxID=1977633 RepID=A0A1V0SD66_9VIRU|nr:hypothetical protein Indivirus_2_35 [Indivirus ILV1]
MSFSLIRKVDPQLVDVRLNYKNIAGDFLTYYYNIYDDDFPRLNNLYYKESQFTFRDKEFYGFSNLMDLIVKTYKIYKFTHSIAHATVQPINNSDLLIVVHGMISVNNSPHFDKYIETILLRRDDSNRFMILNTIFKLV